MTQSRGTRKTARKAALINAPDEIAIPGFVDLLPEAARLWPMLTRARAAREWSEFDLILLAKVANLEAIIRQHSIMLEETGTIISSPKGMPIANPLIGAIDTWQRQQVAIISKLALGNAGADPRQSARDISARSRIEQALAEDAEGILARPKGFKP